MPNDEADRAGATGRLVLLVDDHDDSREMLAEFLSFSGFRTAEAGNGREALEKARNLRPDVVVTDLALPELDGWEVTRRLRGDKDTEEIRVVVLSGHSQGGAEERAREAGCDAFVLKPCMPDELVAQIRRLLERPRACPGRAGSSS